MYYLNVFFLSEDETSSDVKESFEVAEMAKLLEIGVESRTNLYCGFVITINR